MPLKKSAGILLYRRKNLGLEVFLVHPGGPFWKNKDAGSWSIPKGEFTADEDSLEAAIREFKEETGKSIDGNFRELEPVTQKGGKTVYAWIAEGDIETHDIRSNLFEMQWPPGSGKLMKFPEIDKGEWFTIDQARVKINKGQLPFLDQLEKLTG
jgi:predicted NUDIX family NTP pyrophosphohydrolase